MIAAEGEQKASRALREAAETIADSHSALQVSHSVTKKVILLSINISICIFLMMIIDNKSNIQVYKTYRPRVDIDMVVVEEKKYSLNFQGQRNVFSCSYYGNK